MKKIIKLVAVVMFIAMVAVPISAANLPGDGAEAGVPDVDKVWYLTFDALSDLPDNYGEIYGFSFVVDLAEDSIDQMLGTGDIYWTIGFVDDGADTGVSLENAVMHWANQAILGIAAMINLTLEPLDLVAIEAGDTKTMTYVADDALFTDGTNIAKVRLAIGEGAVGLGMSYDITGFQWLDANGQVVTDEETVADTTADTAEPGDSINFYLVGLLVMSAVAFVVLKSRHNKVNES